MILLNKMFFKKILENITIGTKCMFFLHTNDDRIKTNGPKDIIPDLIVHLLVHASNIFILYSLLTLL